MSKPPHNYPLSNSQDNKTMYTMATGSRWSKTELFGAKNGTPVDIETDEPIKLNKLEAWIDDTQKNISGIQFTYTDQRQGQRTVTFGLKNSTPHVLFDAETHVHHGPVVDLFGFADTNVVHKLGIRSHAGEEIGKSFKIAASGRSIVAFYGYSDGNVLNAVGAYVYDAP